MVIAALIVVAIAIASFIYSFVKNSDDAKIDESMKNGSAVIELSPGSNVQTPKSYPKVPVPTTPPPSSN